MTRDRSLRTVVRDGFSAPRYVHHLVKLATGAIALAFCGLASGSWRVGAALSLAWFLSFRVVSWLESRGAFITPDLWCDLALHMAAVAVAVIVLDSAFVGVGLAVVCGIVYAATYPEASP